MLFVLVFWILLIGLVVWAIVQFLPRLAGKPADDAIASPGSRQDSALDILQLRYARGEISKSDYEQIRDDLVA